LEAFGVKRNCLSLLPTTAISDAKQDGLGTLLAPRQDELAQVDKFHLGQQGATLAGYSSSLAAGPGTDLKPAVHMVTSAAEGIPLSRSVPK